MKLLNENDMTTEFVKSIGNSRGDILKKIHGLRQLRADFHGHDDIQELCNQLLDKLYDLYYQGEKVIKDKNQLNRMPSNYKSPNRDYDYEESDYKKAVNESKE